MFSRHSHLQSLLQPFKIQPLLALNLQIFEFTDRLLPSRITVRFLCCFAVVFASSQCSLEDLPLMGIPVYDSAVLSGHYDHCLDKASTGRQSVIGLLASMNWHSRNVLTLVAQVCSLIHIWENAITNIMDKIKIMEIFPKEEHPRVLFIYIGPIEGKKTFLSSSLQKIFPLKYISYNLI